jgi:hypothetical protein
MLFVKSSFKKSLSFFFLFWYPNHEWTHMNDDPCKGFKNIFFGTKKLKKKQKMELIWTYENMIKFYHSKIPNY